MGVYIRPYMRFSSTPFFSALGPLLFGRPPCSELKKLQAQAQGTDSISELRKALGQFVPDVLFGQDKRGARLRLFTPLVHFLGVSFSSAHGRKSEGLSTARGVKSQGVAFRS